MFHHRIDTSIDDILFRFVLSFIFDLIFQMFDARETVSVRSPFLCPECGKRYRTNRNLQNHQKVHGANTIQCPECPATFYNKMIFNQHYEIHQNMKYECKECNITYAQKKGLMEHRRELKIFQSKSHHCFFLI